MLHFCRVGGGAVFLDVGADRYFRLAPDQERAFLERPADHEGQREDPVLADAGLDRAALVAPDHAPPERSALEVRAGPGRGQLRHAVPAVIAITRCALRLRVTPFARAIDRVERRPRQRPGQAPMPDATVHDLARSFEAWRRLIPVPRRCLLDSLALIDFLARRHCYPRFVIGVTLYPFAAHCWVQQGEWALNEKTDYARSFTPILVA